METKEIKEMKETCEALQNWVMTELEPFLSLEYLERMEMASPFFANILRKYCKDVDPSINEQLKKLEEKQTEVLKASQDNSCYFQPPKEGFTLADCFKK